MATATNAQMYTLKSYQKDVPVELPTVMYMTKSYHRNSEQVASSSGPMAALEQRQEAVLEKLEQLRSSVSQLKQKYNIAESCPPPVASSPLAAHSSATVDSSVPALGSGTLDIVISADPASVPLSLLVLCGSLCERFSVLQQTYVHSSVSGQVPHNLVNLLKSSSSLKRANAQIAITLVWKKVTNGAQLMVDPTRQTPVVGEVNIARYLTRLLHPATDLDAVTATQTDELLDLAHLQLINGNTKERGAAVRSLNSSLGKSGWLVSQQPGLADLLVWSALQQTGQAASAPANVKKWLAACAKHPMFEKAASLVS